MFYRSTILTTENAGDLQQMLDIVVIESGKKGHYYLKKKKQKQWLSRLVSSVWEGGVVLDESATDNIP